GGQAPRDLPQRCPQGGPGEAPHHPPPAGSVSEQRRVIAAGVVGTEPVMNASAQVQRRQKPHVVVVGGGFAGLSAVRALRHVDVDVTLIDRHPYNTFYPLLYQVATATLNPGDITYFLRAVRARQKNMRFVNGTVTAMDHTAREIVLD